MKQSTTIVLVIAVVAILAVASVGAYLMLKEDEPPASLRMATTSSTWDSGLLEYILPVFEDEYNCEVDVVAVGSGQAMELGKNGDVDVLMVHSPAAEVTFVNDGYGTNRTQLMYNWFVIVGPNGDPAGTRNATNASDAFQRIYDNGTAGSVTFVSRADNSGTHNKELTIWSKLGYNKTEVAAFDSDWYKQSGQNMGAVLDICENEDSYTLSDDATYYSKVDLAQVPHLNITVGDDPALKNQYSVILVNASKWTHINATMARNFLNWIVSDDGQDLIASYERYGKQLFFPNAPGYSTSTLNLSKMESCILAAEAAAVISRIGVG